MSFFLSPIGNEQQFDANGSPLNAGRIQTYLAGSTTPTATYTDNTGATQQANPIILNSLGLPASPIWLNGGITYKFVIQDANSVTLRTVDNISGINDTTATQTEWVSSGLVPTFISTVSFSVPGDQTGALQIGRRLRTQNTAGLIYSRITNSVFAATITTVTVVNDSGVLDSGLSSVAYGVAAPISPSLPNSAAVRDTMGITTARQNQEGIAYTTAGTSTAYTLTPSPAITAYMAGQAFDVTFHTASGAAPTMQISGVATPPNLVRRLADGTVTNILAGDIPAGTYRVRMLSATQVEVIGLWITSEINSTPLLHINDIVNGDFRIAQAGTSFAAPTSAVYDLDGWLNNNSTTSVFTISQVAGSVAGRLARQVTITTADAAVAAGDFVLDTTRIEGHNILKYVGKTFTVAGRAKVPVTGIHCIYLRNSGNDRSYVAEVNFTVANTWTDFSFTVTGGLPTAGTWNYTNGIGLEIGFTHMAGATFQTTANAWNTGNFFGTANQVNDCATIGNVWALEKLTMNLGTVAAVSEISYEKELARCQRYYETARAVVATAVAVTAPLSTVYWKAIKRAIPTLVVTVDAGVGATFTVLGNGGNTNFGGSLDGAFQSAAHSVQATAAVTASARL